jgi:hypothetical protein
MSPFHAHDAALQAHARMPQGTQYRLLEDDPETPEELRAERDRMRMRAIVRRRREQAAVARMLAEVAQ